MSEQRRTAILRNLERHGLGGITVNDVKWLIDEHVDFEAKLEVMTREAMGHYGGLGYSEEESLAIVEARVAAQQEKEE